MSANIDTMLYVGEVPWHKIGTYYETPPENSEDIIKGAKLSWTVASAPMIASLNGNAPEQVQKYSAIYRKDNGSILGVVNSPRIRIVQNSDMFNAVEPMLGDYIQTETAASLGDGETVFGCFKIQESYKVLDDTIDQYFVVMNEHGKPDGKVTVLNTPVRVVCANTLSQALSNNIMKMRVPVDSDLIGASLLVDKLHETADKVKDRLSSQAAKMVQKRIEKSTVEFILDELFPMIETNDGESSHDRANEKMMMRRQTFVENCLGADNLANYAGTAYQVFNAATDFFQHYYSNMMNAYDLNYRMNMLPGYGIHEGVGKVNKVLKILKAA